LTTTADGDGRRLRGQARTIVVADLLGAAAKAEILGAAASIPIAGWSVPQLRRAGFAELSHAVAIPAAMATPAAPPSDRNPAESETEMTPFTKAAAAAALTAAVAMQATAQTPARAQDAAGPIVLYTNDFEGVITERFEADTGREIDVVQMSGGELLARIAAEANNPQWDVLIFNGSYTMHGLDRQGQLMRDVAPDNIANLNDVGRAFLPDNRSWFPIGLVASCVMLYRDDLVDNPPARFEDLTDPRFNGLFGMADPAVAAPAYPCVASFFHDMGQDAARALFTGYFQNGMRVFRTNGPTGRALASGDIHVALITSQVAYSQIAAGEPLTVVWPEDGAPGSVRGAAIQAATARPEGALAFIEWLLEPATQTHLAEAAASDGLFEPTVTGALRRADGPPEGARYRVAPDPFAVQNEELIKTWFADQALN
jgi:ABC-type Fe3+ transport system substrate-binding protein